MLLCSFGQKNKMSQRNFRLRSILWSPVAAGMWVEAPSHWNEVCGVSVLCWEARGLSGAGCCRVMKGLAQYLVPGLTEAGTEDSAKMWVAPLWSLTSSLFLGRGKHLFVCPEKFCAESLQCLNAELVSGWFVEFQVAGAWRKMRQWCLGSWDCKVQWQV